jgi:hypothetical protein
MNGISSTGGLGVIQSATSLINRAQAGAARDAATIASSSVAGNSGADIVGALVDARQQVLYSHAGAKLISAANEMMGSLIDIRA